MGVGGLTTPPGRPGVCSLKYVSVEEAVEAVLRFGRGAMLAKVDIRDEYRNIPVRHSKVECMYMRLCIYLTYMLEFVSSCLLDPPSSGRQCVPSIRAVLASVTWGSISCNYYTNEYNNITQLHK